MTDERRNEIIELFKKGSTTEIKKLKKEEILEFSIYLFGETDKLKTESENCCGIEEATGPDLITSLKNEIEEITFSNTDLQENILSLTQDLNYEKDQNMKITEKFNWLLRKKEKSNKVSWGITIILIIAIILKFLIII